ncbi:Gfo/Idh/MocA family protein [Actinomadura macrotermitis]|uniref:GFO/IDH/MocA-like oxidoreductase domain-containing protein n=1 Tax=Actinomadura macrotermitis TaxID=2585200 RepID=A0A7K0BWG2_9ACTN|nr:hypothetical protein [Actinomadura macrotermitis]MQY05024.1 hypothetical protein [Actinomadura macrotermitis]
MTCHRRQECDGWRDRGRPHRLRLRHPRPHHHDHLAHRHDGSHLRPPPPSGRPYYALVRQARARLLDGTSGDLRLIHGAYLQDWLLEEGDDNRRVDTALGGASRAFGDIGSHWCDLARFVSGHAITAVSARMFRAHARRRRDPSRTSFSRASATGALVCVDTENTHHVQDALAPLLPGRTTIAITHRLETVRDIHVIFVLDEGRLVEQGTHDDLAARGGRYAALLADRARTPA